MRRCALQLHIYIDRDHLRRYRRSRVKKAVGRSPPAVSFKTRSLCRNRRLARFTIVDHTSRRASSVTFQKPQRALRHVLACTPPMGTRLSSLYLDSALDRSFFPKYILRVALQTISRYLSLKWMQFSRESIPRCRARRSVRVYPREALAGVVFRRNRRAAHTVRPET